MDYSELKKYTMTELKNLANDMGLKSRRSKSEMITQITQAFREYEEYKQEKIDKYTRLQQLGEKGKEGTTYLVRTSKGKEYAMKTFRKGKSSDKLIREFELQKRASKLGIAPRVKEYDTVSKYIVMERLDTHLIDVMKKQDGNLLRWQQYRILDIFNKLDQAGVFHGDANPLNYMFKGKELYIIDFGFSKSITDSLKRKLGTETPNMTLMLLGFILKLKDMNCPPTSYKYLIKKLSQKDIDKFGL